MSVRVDVAPAVLRWARERSGVTSAELGKRFPHLDAWESETSRPTLKQLERYAQATHTPVGLLLLPEPPDEKVPIPDFRTMPTAQQRRPTADLLDTIYQCEQRQEWYRSFAQTTGEVALSFVGSLSTATDPILAASAMRELLRYGISERGSSWSEAFRRLSDAAEALGVLVMVNGVVGSNTHRKLDPEEFRGFALVDPVAPLVFVNGADTKAAQIFTLAHELAHIWAGQTALSDADLRSSVVNDVERWCNQVAGELLAPKEVVQREFVANRPLRDELDRLASLLRVSTLVVLRRVHDIGQLDRDDYNRVYRDELQRVLSLRDETGAGGGNFYNTQPVRVSKRFARAIISSTLEGQTLHRDALHLLGFKKVSTLYELATRLREA